MILVFVTFIAALGMAIFVSILKRCLAKPPHHTNHYRGVLSKASSLSRPLVECWTTPQSLPAYYEDTPLAKCHERRPVIISDRLSDRPLYAELLVMCGEEITWDGASVWWCVISTGSTFEPRHPTDYMIWLTECHPQSVSIGRCSCVAVSDERCTNVRAPLTNEYMIG